MKPTRPSEVIALLRDMDFRPSRVLGQNFLIDGNVLDITMDAAEIARDDIVLEIGPGLGVLTGPLLSRAAKVIAIEKDPKLFAFLQTRFSGALNLELVLGDATDIDLDVILAGGVTKLVANFPYSVASRILVDVCESAHGPLRVVATVQDEVADRLQSSPNRKRYGAISVLVQMEYEVSVRKRIKPSCFYPPPRITSALVVLDRRKQPQCRLEERGLYRDLVRTVFAQRRKKLSTVLGQATPPLAIDRDEFALLAERMGVRPNARPENLNPAQFGELANRLAVRSRQAKAAKDG